MPIAEFYAGCRGFMPIAEALYLKKKNSAREF